ncbi:MAG: hypothetical protein HYX53_12235 [Chloroflexi bacterium]|nr:hypothetical protein [Chloroflexota bacterium]
MASPVPVTDVLEDGRPGHDGRVASAVAVQRGCNAAASPCNATRFPCSRRWTQGRVAVPTEAAVDKQAIGRTKDKENPIPEESGEDESRRYGNIVDDDSADSFPASDPPSFTPLTSIAPTADREHQAERDRERAAHDRRMRDSARPGSEKQR